MPGLRAPLDGEALAALPATAGQDRAAGTGAHPQSEAVRLVTTTVVRLVRPLAHDGPLRFSTGRATRSDRLGWTSAGTAHSRTVCPWACGTGRPRMTAQRYAGAANRVKPTVEVPARRPTSPSSQNPTACGQRVDPQAGRRLGSSHPGFPAAGRDVAPQTRPQPPPSSPEPGADLRKLAVCQVRPRSRAGAVMMDVPVFTTCGQTCGGAGRPTAAEPLTT